MKSDPWLIIIGMDGGGYDRLSADAQHHIQTAEFIIGPKRHLSMLPPVSAVTQDWPVPFADGVGLLLEKRGTASVMLVSGDPFWFGGGTSVTAHLNGDEWRALPGHSCFSLAASWMGWPLERVMCLGLHAAPLSRIRPHLAVKKKIMATMRDGAAVQDLMRYLVETGFGETQVTCLESLGDKAQKTLSGQAQNLTDASLSHPVMVALSIAGEGRVMPRTAGLSDDWFDHDGQITKSPIRALTLSALAPKAGDYLWDLGAGSGSIAIEWLLSDASLRATAVEKHADRAKRIERNAMALGVDHLDVVHSDISAAIHQLPVPDCIFVGGGLREALLKELWDMMPKGTRLVANGVTIETDQLLTQAYGTLGGHLMRLESASLQPIGTMNGWKAAYPITQWSVTK